MRYIVATSLLLVLCRCPSQAQPGVSEVAFSESQHTIRAFSESGEMTVPVVRVQLDVRYPVHKHERGDLIVVYDPASGHYLWRYTGVKGPNDDTSFLHDLEAEKLAVYVGSEESVEFHVGSSLWVKAHRERAESLGAAERASIDGIEHGLGSYEDRGFSTDSKAIPLFRAIGMAFACVESPRDPGFSALCGWGAKIVLVRKDGDKWLLVLRNRWDQEVVLDKDFNLISTRRLEKPVQ